MPTVSELTALYGNFLVPPQPGPGVCRRCFNLAEGYTSCYPCAHAAVDLPLTIPISYSVAHEQVHRMLAGYKRLPGDVARRLQLGLAAVLWRFLATHEACIAGATGVERFELVTTVPSSDAARDNGHPLRRIVTELAAPTRPRAERLLNPGSYASPGRIVDAGRFTPARRLSGEAVLLIDDTLTTGASVRSATAALRQAGAGAVAAVVIGRHVNRSWRDNDRQLRALPPFRWDCCALADRCLVEPEREHAPVLVPVPTPPSVSSESGAGLPTPVS